MMVLVLVAASALSIAGGKRARAPTPPALARGVVPMKSFDAGWTAKPAPYEPKSWRKSERPARTQEAIADLRPIFSFAKIRLMCSRTV